MDTLTDMLGSPALSTAVLLAAAVWAVVRIAETVAHIAADWHARRSGWNLAADPEQLDRLDTMNDHLAGALAELGDMRGSLERIENGLDDDRRPVDVPAPRPAPRPVMAGKSNGLAGLVSEVEQRGER